LPAGNPMRSCCSASACECSTHVCVTAIGTTRTCSLQAALHDTGVNLGHA
jgi:hypothetical protein